MHLHHCQTINMQVCRTVTLLLFFLVVLPETLTYLHFRYVLRGTNFYIVKHTSLHNWFAKKCLTPSEVAVDYHTLFYGS